MPAHVSRKTSVRDCSVTLSGHRQTHRVTVKSTTDFFPAGLSEHGSIIRETFVEGFASLYKLKLRTSYHSCSHNSTTGRLPPENHVGLFDMTTRTRVIWAPSIMPVRYNQFPEVSMRSGCPSACSISLLLIGTDAIVSVREFATLRPANHAA